MRLSMFRTILSHPDELGLVWAVLFGPSETLDDPQVLYGFPPKNTNSWTKQFWDDIEGFAERYPSAKAYLNRGFLPFASFLLFTNSNSRKLHSFQLTVNLQRHETRHAQLSTNTRSCNSSWRENISQPVLRTTVTGADVASQQPPLLDDT